MNGQGLMRVAVVEAGYAGSVTGINLEQAKALGLRRGVLVAERLHVTYLDSLGTG